MNVWTLIAGVLAGTLLENNYQSKKNKNRDYDYDDYEDDDEYVDPWWNA